MSAVHGRSVRRWWLAGLAIPLALVGALLTPAPVARAAAYGSSYAYVHADKPSEYAYVPAGSRNFNTSGGTNDVNRLDTGWYRVRFPDVATKPDASLGVAHVTSYGDSAAYCSVSALDRYGVVNPLTGVSVILGITAQIRCFDAVGAPVDSEFTASWANAFGIGGHSDFAYLTTRLPDVTHELGHDTQFNSTGQVNKMERVGTGRYTVWLPGFGSKGLDEKDEQGHVQVTAHNDQGYRCKVLAFSLNHDDAQVEVACHDAAGNRADSRFSLTYSRDASIVWSPWGAYTRVSGTWTFPQWTYPDDYATVTQGVGAGEGIFWVQTSLDGFMEHGNVQVTAEGPGAHHCKVAGWSPDKGIEVRCFNYKGDPVRNPFLVSFAL
jgi:hypothetical protein